MYPPVCVRVSLAREDNVCLATLLCALRRTDMIDTVTNEQHLWHKMLLFFFFNLWFLPRLYFFFFPCRLSGSNRVPVHYYFLLGLVALPSVANGAH